MLSKNILNKVLDKVKMIRGIEILLIETDDKLPDDITLKNAVILVTSVIKNKGKFYQQIFLEKALVVLKIISIGTY